MAGQNRTRNGIRRIDRYSAHSKARRHLVVWECKCSCGKTCYVRASCLKSGQTRSCGHLREKDYTGLRSGRLVAVKAQKQRDKDGYGIIWLCRCDCGGVKLIIGTHLRYGAVNPAVASGTKSDARCPGCGKRFPITLDGTPTPQVLPGLRTSIRWAKLEGLSCVS